MSYQAKLFSIVFFIALTMLCTASAFPASYSLGTEFHINTYTSDNQFLPAVASNGQDYFVTWSSNGQDGSGSGIYGQRIDSTGNFQGSEFQINSDTIYNQDTPAVASNGQDYLVTWQSYQDGDGYGIYGQRIDASGNFTGSEFQINTYTTNLQYHPSVASNGQDYLVTWDSNGQDGDKEGVYGQRVNSSGNLEGGEFQINTYNTNFQRCSSVASDGQDYLVTWQSAVQDGDDYGIYGQRMDSTGNFLGAEFLINTYTTNLQKYPSITSNGQDYLVTWQSNGQDGDEEGVYGQLIDSAGNFIGAEFLINTYTMNSQNSPSVISNGEDFLLTWQSYGQDGSSYGIYGQLIDSAGNFIGDEFLINTYTPDSQDGPSVASNGQDFIVSWTSTIADFGNNTEIYGKIITKDSATVVPEPVSILLFLAALFGLFGKYYRR